MIRPRIALGIRAQLLLVLTVFLAIPWLGYEYVRELERFLRDAQERTLGGTAQAVATALHDRPRLFEARPAPLESLGSGAGERRGRRADRGGCARPRRRSGRSSTACRARRRASGSSIASSTSGTRGQPEAAEPPPGETTRRRRHPSSGSGNGWSAKSYNPCMRACFSNRPRTSATSAPGARCRGQGRRRRARRHPDRRASSDRRRQGSDRVRGAADLGW